MAGLKIENLGLYQRDRWLFRNLELEVPAGTFVAIVGPSGVGKTSFLSCLAGMRSPSEGSIHYNNGKQQALAPRSFRRHIGVIFQQFLLTENETVLTNVLCGRLNQYSCLRTLFGFPRTLKDEAYAILCDLGLADFAYRYTARISGGEKQRVAVARALFQGPQCFLADEPVSQLDSYLTGRVLGLLRLQASEQKRTVFCVLHNPDLVHRFADYALSFNREHPERWHMRRIRGS